MCVCVSLDGLSSDREPFAQSLTYWTYRAVCRISHYTASFPISSAQRLGAFVDLRAFRMIPPSIVSAQGLERTHTHIHLVRNSIAYSRARNVPF